MNLFSSRVTNLKLPLVLFCLLAIASCSSVPISTLLKFSRMESTEISAIAPEQVRVRLTMDEPIRLAKKSVRLQIKLAFSDQPTQDFEFNLAAVSEEKKLESSGWFQSDKKRNQYEFRLNRLAQLEFSNFQKLLGEQSKIEHYYWTVFYYLVPHNETDAMIDVELKLSAQEDYFYLLQGAKVEINTKTK